jgi:phage shock protein A
MSHRSVDWALQLESTPSVVRLKGEVAKLEDRCRAHEHAMEHLSAAVIRLRRANGALSEENSLLRLELERLRASAAAGSNGLAH